VFGITVLIPTSPIPSHPDVNILRETIASIRAHLPHEKIIMLFDGVRPEQADRKNDYMQYMDRVAGLIEPGDSWVASDKHKHQVGMMRGILPAIETELLLFIEHDTPLVTDEPIDWYGICQAITSGDVNLVRFAHEAHILPDHAYLMEGALWSRGVHLMKTKQFSARPHVATVEFYKNLLQKFSPGANCFIEDKAHSICQDDPWDTWKLSIYNPPGGNIKRSYHLDGRAQGEKFDDQQVF